MKNTKLARVLYWGLMPIVAVALFLIGLGIGLSDNETIEVEKKVEVVKEVPVETIKEVEKIVYKDSKETLDLLELHRTTGCAYTGVYPSMFEIMKAYASDWGLSSMITQDMYDLENMAEDYMVKYCD